MDAVTQWLQQYPEYSGLVVFIITFVESFAFVGALVPGVVILFAASALIGSTGTMDLLPLILIAGVASVTANVLSFFIGYGLKDRIRHISWLERHQNWISTGERFIDRWGVLSVVLGRFVGPIRPFVAFIAGGLAMPPRRFVVLDLLTVIVWAPIYIMPGYLTGLAMDELVPPVNQWPPAVTLSAGTFVGLALFAFGNYWLQGHRPMYRPLVDRLGTDELPLASALVLVLSLLLLIWLGRQVPLASDTTFAVGLAEMDSPLATSIFTLLATLTAPALLQLLALMWALFFLLQGFRTAASLLIAAMLLTQWLVPFLQQEWSIQIATIRYPSLEACLLTVFIGLWSGLVNESRPYTRRWQLYMVTGLLTALLLFSLLFVVHQSFSSILAGLLLGSLITAACRLLYSFIRHRPYRIRSEGWLMLAYQLLTLVLYLLWRRVH